ncbi:predicted protein [Brucella abortus bv. 2 str. 86/8/59]|nr:predicted protein [Brucella abortus bv. 2 str. 86/8/59]
MIPVSFSNIFFICSQMTTSAEQIRLRLPAAWAENANDDTPAASAATMNAERIIFLPLYGASTPTLCQRIYSLRLLNRAVNHVVNFIPIFQKII